MGALTRLAKLALEHANRLSHDPATGASSVGSIIRADGGLGDGLDEKGRSRSSSNASLLAQTYKASSEEQLSTPGQLQVRTTCSLLSFRRCGYIENSVILLQAVVLDAFCVLFRAKFDDAREALLAGALVLAEAGAVKGPGWLPVLKLLLLAVDPHNPPTPSAALSSGTENSPTSEDNSHAPSPPTRCAALAFKSLQLMVQEFLDPALVRGTP